MTTRRARQPVIVATWRFGATAVRAGAPILAAGGSALDAVEAAARAVEDDPAVDSVGTGGLPNAEGVVELDACIMDGRTRAFGAVAALRRIANPVSVARRVMERTPHLMLVGEGAYRFARAQGFRPANLLTPRARKAYRLWRASRKGAGRAGPPAPSRAAPADWHDTVGVLALDAAGRLAGACTTSGMPWKMPGRVGDSPLIGCGLYVDDRYGAAVCTGYGEEIMRIAAAAVIVEAMRRGDDPAAACLQAARRVAERARRDPRKPGAAFLALTPDGRVGAASVHRRYFPYALFREGRLRLYEKAPGVLPPRAPHLAGGH